MASDLPASLRNLKRVLESSCWTVRGPHDRCAVEDFEDAWALEIGSRYAVAVSSGSSAVEIALRGLGVGRGDEVVVPAIGWYADAAAVMRTGAEPRYADVDVTTSCATPESIGRSINSRTGAIIIVHLHGSVAEMDTICELAAREGIPLIEDAAQSHGARYKGLSVGCLGDIGCFSFNQEKLICGGEGGIVVTDSSDLYHRLYALRTDGYLPPEPGQEPSHPHGGVPGGNLCLSELQAAHLLVQMQSFEEQQAVRERNAAALERALSRMPEVEVLRSSPQTTRRVYYEFGVLLDPAIVAEISRDQIAQALSAEVGFEVHATDGPPWQGPNMVIQEKPSVPNGAQELHDRLLVFHHRMLLDSKIAEIFPDALARVLRSMGNGQGHRGIDSSSPRALLGQQERRVESYDALVSAWSESRRRACLPEGRWSLAGELDSPIPPGRLEEVKRRSRLTIAQLLLRHCEQGGLLVAVDDGREGCVEDLIVDQAQRYRKDSSFLPIWLRCWEFDLAHGPDEVLRQYFRRVVRETPADLETGPKVIVMERPELARFEGGALDGVRAREILCRWKAFFPSDRIVAVVGPESFVARDPYPGFYGIDFDDPAAPTISDRGASEELDFFPPEPVPRQLLDHFLEAMASKPDADDQAAFFAAYRLFSTHLKGWPLDKVFFSTQQLDRLRPGSETLRIWLRRLVEPQPDPERHFRDPRLRSLMISRNDALVSTRLYALIDQVAGDAASKRTFSDCDPATWLCFLRSQGYEYVAVVGRHLRREVLSGKNLVHAPNLEFACLRGADLSDSDLYRINLSYADLREVCFAGADLSRSHLKGADLRGADLRDADLSYCSLELADLRGADLRGADLERSFTDGALGLG